MAKSSGRHSPTKETGDPPWRDGKKINCPRLGKQLLDETPFAKTPGGELNVFRNGRYEEGGEDSIRLRVNDELDDLWKRHHENEVVEFIRGRAPKFAERPPDNVIIVANGTIDVKPDGGGIDFTECDRPDLLTPVYLPVKYEPKASPVFFNAFMERSVGDPDVIALHQEITGYLLVPDNRQQKAFLNQGTEGAGKSTLLRVQGALLGEHNCSSWPLHALAEKPFARADLYGKLANISADLSSRELRSSAEFRAITGGDRIMGEKKYQDAFSWTPYARLLFSTNKFPLLRDPSAAMFDRWIVLPWQRKFRGTEDEDKKLAEKLTDPVELSGVLNWALAGLQRLRKRGSFAQPKEAEMAMARFRRDSDLVRVFVEEWGAKLEPRMAGSSLYVEYQCWCDITGHRAVGRTTFYERLDNAGARRFTRANQVWIDLDEVLK